MRRDKQQGGVCWAAVLVLWLLATPVWGYYFDDRREMNLSGFAYSRATIALQDGRGNRGLGISNNKDNVWVELQYLLY
jgi:hypothetical protein